MDIREMRVIIEQAKIIQDCAKNLDSTSISLLNIPNRETLILAFSLNAIKVNILIRSYNAMLPSVNKFFIDSNSHLNLKEVEELKNVDSGAIKKENTLPDYETALIALRLGCAQISNFFEINIELSKENVERLNSLTEELNQLKTELEADTYQNIIEAKNTFEKGCLLGSSLICGRAIRASLDKVDGKDINEKIEFLKSQKIIGEKDGKDFLLKANHFGRNITTHDTSVFPTTSDALSYIADSIKIARIVSKIRKLTPSL